ncbi:MAG TPA: efflux RND transporter periplasmic adaptor subunit [Candidatus Acidoferrum sp.]|jgi:multidrug efflux pump subunit AcrA (membrane-fusion protein)
MNVRITRKTHVASQWRAALLLPLCWVALLAGCSSAEKEPEIVVAVQTTPAKRGPIELTVSSAAVVFPLEQAVIAPKITSTISKFYVQRGSPVKKGQALAQLENADLAGVAEQSKGNFEQAEANYKTTTGASVPQQIQKAELDAAAAKAAFEAQQKVYNSRKELFDQGAIPRRDLDAAEVAMIQARSQNEQAQKQLADLQRLGKEQALKAASGQLSAAKGTYENAQAQLSYSVIHSPIDGVVTDRPLYQGELATANQPILTVMNTSKLIAKAHVPQSEAVLLKVGDRGELSVSGVEEPIPGRVLLVSPALDPGSTTVEIWVEALKKNPALKPGMNVQIEATAKSVKDALVVPAGAVFKSPEAGDYVMIAGKDGKARLEKVKIGIRNKELAEIQSGIKENDPVITAGGYALPDGTKIKVEAAPAAEPEKDKDAADAGDKPDAAPDKKASTPAAPAKGKE